MQNLPHRSSRLSGFYQKSIAERVAILSDWADLTPEEVTVLHNSLSVNHADKMIENVVGRYCLPMGIAANFRINGWETLVPMVVEEPSVVAGVSYAAKLARDGGGLWAGSTAPVMIAQIQLLDVKDPAAASAAIVAEKSALLELANTSPTIARLGGGPVELEVREFPVTPTSPMLVVHLLFDTQDAMGANALNTAAETLAPTLERLTGGTALLRILSNLTDRRRAWAEVVIPADSFSTIHESGDTVIRNIAHANAFAWVDPYRAATHNKGIMNGVDAVAVATGNDWRALEAGAHAYAARDGQYRTLTEWAVIETAEDLRLKLGRVYGSGQAEQSRSAVDMAQFASLRSAIFALPFPVLYGYLDMPLAVGIVGGATRAHPGAQVALKILGVTSARQLSEIMAAVGLAQNLAAIRALATEGIQQGHMSLHARQVAIAAGATGMAVDRIAAQLVREGEVRLERARALLAEDSVDR